MRQRTVTLRIAEKALAVLDEQRRGGLGESALQNDTQRQINVAFELGFGNAGFLKILPIEIGDTVVAQRIERPAAAPERRRNTQARNGRENIRPEQRRVPGDRAAPVMADDGGALFAECRHQRDHVADIVEDGVGADIRRRGSASKPAHIGRHDMEARGRDGRDLMPPGIRKFRPAMTKHNKRTFALFAQKELDPVGGNGAGG